MFDFVANTAGPDNKTITEWRVMFMTPLGIIQTLPEAIEVCKKHDWHPNLVLVPVPVALTEGSYEAAMMK